MEEIKVSLGVSALKILGIIYTILGSVLTALGIAMGYFTGIPTMALALSSMGPFCRM